MQSCTAKFSACIALLAAVTGFAPGHARTGPGLQPPCRSAPGRGLHSAGPRAWVTLGGGAGTRALSLPHGCPLLPSPPQTALAGREPTQPEGMCSATLSGNKPAAAERPWGPARGTARPMGTVGTSGGGCQASAREPREAGRGRRGAGSGAWGNSQLPCSGTCGPGRGGPARAGTSTAGNGRGAAAGLALVELESVGGAGAGLGIPPSPARGTSRGDGDGMGWDAAPRGHCHLPPAARPPAGPPAPLKGALRGPAARGGAARGSAAENTGTSP